MVAASQRTSVLHSEDHLPAVQDSKLGSAGPPFRILRAAQLRKLSRANESRWVAGVRAHGTDKVPGEPELSRPMARAAPTPSKGMCALHVCRCAVA